jgi:hypothetical protein
MRFQHDPKIRELARSTTDLRRQETKSLLNFDKMLSKERGQLEATLDWCYAKQAYPEGSGNGSTGGGSGSLVARASAWAAEATGA